MHCLLKQSAKCRLCIKRSGPSMNCGPDYLRLMPRPQLLCTGTESNLRNREPSPIPIDVQHAGPRRHERRPAGLQARGDAACHPLGQRAVQGPCEFRSRWVVRGSGNHGDRAETCPSLSSLASRRSKQPSSVCASRSSCPCMKPNG